jgi:hypothetical protein
MGEIEGNPAEVYERYLGRAIADPFTRVLLQSAEPKRGERVLDFAAGSGSVARQSERSSIIDEIDGARGWRGCPR